VRRRCTGVLRAVARDGQRHTHGPDRKRRADDCRHHRDDVIGQDRDNGGGVPGEPEEWAAGAVSFARDKGIVKNV
jgi:hypothetical protein